MKLYSERDPIDQELLQALAVIHMPCTNDQFLDYVQTIPKSRFTKLSRDVLSARLKDLCESPLIYTRNETMQLRFELNQELYSKLVWSQKLAQFIEGATQSFPLLKRLCTADYSDELKREVAEIGSECILFSMRRQLYLEKAEHQGILGLIDTFIEVFPEEYQKKHPYLRIFDTPFQELWFVHFSPETTAHIHLCLLHQKLNRLRHKT